MTNKSKPLRFMAVLVAGSLMAGPVLAQDELAAIKARMNPLCSEEAQNIVAESVRQTIEDAVTRGEASIKPPISLGDLSCLQGLMSAPIDIFSGVGGILGSLTGDLAGQAASLPNGLSSRICAFAAEKWGELTEPVTAGLNPAGDLSFDMDEIWANLNNTSGSVGNGSTGTTVQNPDPIGNWNSGEGDLPDPTEEAPTYTMEEFLEMIRVNSQNTSGSGSTSPQPAPQESWSGDDDRNTYVPQTTQPQSLNDILLGGGSR